MNNVMERILETMKQTKLVNEKAGREFYESIKDSLPKESESENINFKYKYNQSDIDRLNEDDYLWIINNSVNYPSIIKGFNSNTDSIELLGFNIYKDPEKEDGFIIELDYRVNK